MGEEAKQLEITIVSMVDVPAIEPGRVGQLDVMVTYQVRPGQVYTVRIPKEKFTEELMIESIRKDLQERLKFVGKKYTIPVP